MQPTEAVDKLVAWLARRGLKVTRQRRLITEVFFDQIHRESTPGGRPLHAGPRPPGSGTPRSIAPSASSVESGAGLSQPPRGTTRSATSRDPGAHHDHLVLRVRRHPGISRTSASRPSRRRPPPAWASSWSTTAWSSTDSPPPARRTCVAEVKGERAPHRGHRHRIDSIHPHGPRWTDGSETLLVC
ncbi:MAG: hypothetical protein R3F43_18695 [bacterium]